MSLIALSEFVEPDEPVYLATAGQGLVPRAGVDACRRYFEARARGGAASRDGLLETAAEVKAELAALLGAVPAEVALTGSTSQAIHAIYSAIEWRAGDNVVTPSETFEFPSVVLPALRRGRGGVEVRSVAADDGVLRRERIVRAVDERTRLVFVSHVSYRTGQRLDIAALAAALRERSAALLALDASQSLGVVPVPARSCDFVVSTAFKWLLGPHGVAVLYWNRARRPDAAPEPIGWHSVVDDQRPYRLKPDAERFEPGNPAYLAFYPLREGLRLLRGAGAEAIEAHATGLGSALIAGIERRGLALLTPSRPAARAGIVSWSDPRCERTARQLATRGIRVTGNAGRVRAALHLYNDAEHVQRLLAALSEIGSATEPDPLQ